MGNLYSIIMILSSRLYFVLMSYKNGSYFLEVFFGGFWARYRPSYLATLALIFNMGAEKNTHRKRSNVVCETGLTVKCLKISYLIQRQSYRCQACYGNERIPRTDIVLFGRMNRHLVLQLPGLMRVFKFHLQSNLRYYFWNTITFATLMSMSFLTSKLR